MSVTTPDTRMGSSMSDIQMGSYTYVSWTSLEVEKWNKNILFSIFLFSLV